MRGGQWKRSPSPEIRRAHDLPEVSELAAAVCAGLIYDTGVKAPEMTWPNASFEVTLKVFEPTASGTVML
jgi:hypothetical protein